MPTVVITGAGSGLGRALALRWAAAGWQVIVTDRDATRASQTLALLAAGPAHSAHALDVTSDADFAALLTAIDGMGVDVLVNNAGVASAGSLANTPLSEWSRVIDVNLMGVVRGCRALAPALAAGRGGHVVNIASFAGLANAPAMGPYNVTKAGVIALSETLRTEWLAQAIGVTVVCPSFFQTALLDEAQSFGVDIKGIGGKLMARSPLDADDVARMIVDAVAAGRFMCIPHRDARWLYRLKRFAPGLFARLLTSRAKALLRPSASKN